MVDTDTARRRLEEERERLVALRDRAPEAQTPEPGDVEDQGADAASLTFNREVNQSVVEQAESDIDEVDAALQRLEDGTYGICEVGGERISDERLEAQPATRHCLEHQQQFERREAAGGYEGADPTI